MDVSEVRTARTIQVWVRLRWKHWVPLQLQ